MGGAGAADGPGRARRCPVVPDGKVSLSLLTISIRSHYCPAAAQKRRAQPRPGRSVSFDPRSATPLYQQVAADIRRQIVSGAMPVGAQLQTHRELATTYGVSLITINKALSGLVSEGVLHSRVGRGTLISVCPIEAGAPNVLGFVLRALSSPFVSPVARAAQHHAQSLGYGMLFSAHANRFDRE